MKKLLALVFAAGTITASSSSTNILVNCAFAPDGLGGVLDWSLRSMATSRIERSAENGPGGLPAYRIVFGKTESFCDAFFCGQENRTELCTRLCKALKRRNSDKRSRSRRG